jgi:hypothetical protein
MKIIENRSGVDNGQQEKRLNIFSRMTKIRSFEYISNQKQKQHGI